MAGDGDANAEFVKLLLAHESRLYAFILSLLPNRTQADDILQETALVLFRRFSEFQCGTNFFAWACKIALHKVLDFRKRQARGRTVTFGPELMETLAEEQIQDSVNQQRRAEALAGCLGRLEPADRELVESYYRSRVFVKEFAEQLNRPVDTIYKKLRRIRASLHACISNRLATESER